MTASGLPARIGYALVAFPTGALLGYVAALKLLIRFGSVFEDPHPSMQGFGYFMMSLAAAATLALTASLIALTLPWSRPVKVRGRIARIITSVLLVLFAFVILSGQGHAPIFIFALTIWLAAVAYFTFIRHGIFDSPPIATDAQDFDTVPQRE